MNVDLKVLDCVLISHGKLRNRRANASGQETSICSGGFEDSGALYKFYTGLRSVYQGVENSVHL